MKNQALASFMRIRHYVFDWLAASKGSVMRLPSSRELAEKFGVSQPTVVRALQELVKEGYLTNRPGVGLFSNPDKLATREGRIWGIVFGDGRWAFLSRDAFHMANCIGRELLERDNHNLLKLITMGETQQEQFPELSMLSGICWWCGEEKVIADMRRIAETIPVVVMSGRIPGFDSYYYDFESENYEIAKWMIANGSRRLALVMSGDRPEAVAGVERACAEAGLTFPAGYILGPDRESEQELDRMVALGCQPDGILFNCKAIGFPEAIRRHPELDRCLIACDDLWVDRKWQFNGLRIHTHFDRVAAEVVDLLEAGVDRMPRKERKLPVSHEIVFASVPENNRSVKHETATLYID